ncbi:uncharacterized protein LOC107487679 [Arachis duranensis]|uniref:Uncharacterized protein LOC107487679 n=1 Tax=Arachis duranensis TaxID=130453 RepID=A0A6P4DC19_ARADU|nr:uncharacterized protein LOC107487679 [Arachis duranensis]
MAGEDSFVALVHCSGKIQKSRRHGVKFTDREPVSIFIRSSSTLAEIKLSILQKLGTCGTKQVKKLFYKIPITVVSTGVRFETFVIGSDEDLQVLFHCRRSFPEVRIPEMFAKLEDRVDSSGASAPGPQSTTGGGASTSLPLVHAVVLPPEPERAEVEFEVGPDRVENALCDDDSDEEPLDIGGDSEDDIPIAAAHGGSGSATQEYPPHLSSLNLEALGQHQNVEQHSMDRSKEEAVLSVKDYSIRRGVEYRVMESDSLKYQGRCKEFGNGCTWLIRIVMRKRKST